MTPFLDGPTVALVVMKVCDLLGCTEASSAGLVDLTTSS
jgi:hypothetical protein